jgi:hypothetical protein
MDEKSYAGILLVAAGVSVWLAYSMFKESTKYHKWSNDPVLKRKK